MGDPGGDGYHLCFGDARATRQQGTCGAESALLAVAIIDDIGAITIIAVFYTAELKLDMMALTMLPLGALWLLNRSDVAQIWPYALVALVL
ncbi:MAG: Na+/H+ antiporter NhaA [Parerythrobacter sp.]